MLLTRFARTLTVLAAAVAVAGCVTVAPVASPTTAPTVAPTASPAPTAPPTTPPTAFPTAPPTAPPTPPPTAKPTDAPTASPTTEPTTPPNEMQLDPNQTARYGSLDPLGSGFSPDPMEVPVVAGGPIDVHYLGGPCVGFAEPNPDYEVHYNAGGQTMLRVYFVASAPGENATLIINDPNSHWQCNDDSYGTADPTLEFSPPESGWYDIWVASFSSGAFVSGTLYITELDSSHP